MGQNSVISFVSLEGAARFAALQEYAEEQSGLNNAEGDEHEDDCFDVHKEDLPLKHDGPLSRAALVSTLRGLHP